MLLIPCFLGPSSIEGIGLFTSEPIVRGTEIWRFDPRFDRLVLMSDLEAASPIMQDFLWRYTYPSKADPSVLILEADEARHMNHSDEPNTDFSDGMVATAVRDIAAGDELTCNYRDFLGEVIMFPGRHRPRGGASPA